MAAVYAVEEAVGDRDGGLRGFGGGVMDGRR